MKLRKILALALSACLLLSVLAGLGFAAPQEAPADNFSWPTGQAMPHFSAPAEQLDAVCYDGMPLFDKVTTATLEGIVNRTQPRVMAFEAMDYAKYWPTDLGLNYVMTDLKSAILKYRDELAGLIVINPEVIETVNVATTAAGIENCLAVSPELAAELSEAPYSLPVKLDLREAGITNKTQAYDYLLREYWPKCTRRAIFGLVPDGHIPLRDLAVAVRGAVLWLNPADKDDKAILEKFFQDSSTIDTYYLGWWPSEGDGVAYASQYGVMTVAADFYKDSTVYSGMSHEITVPAVPAKPALDRSKIYVSLNYSDGDNIQYMQGAMRLGHLWGNENRGKVPIGWTASPVLLDAGPQLLNYYYRTATENDVLICGPTGLGYSSADNWRSLSDLKKYGEITNDYFERSAFNIITAWGLLAKAAASIYSSHIPSLLGMTMQERMFESKFFTASDVPVVWFGNDLPNGGAMSYDEGTENVRRQLSAIANTKYLTTPQFYAAQFVAWSTSVTDITRMVDDINAEFPNRFEFVRPDHFMMLLREAEGKPFPVGLQKTATAFANSADAAKVTDSSFSTGWQAVESDGQNWLMLDLGQEYKLDRYVLKNAGSNYMDSSLNTKGWQIQMSPNGVDSWKILDSVTNNEADIVYRDLPQTATRYIRILVTDAGADNTIRIQDFEVYGSTEPPAKNLLDMAKEIPENAAVFYMQIYTLVNLIIGRIGNLLRGWGWIA